MKVAIPLTAGRLSAHFGHCEQFALVEADPASKKIINQTMLTPPPHEPGLLPRWLQQQGVQAVIAGGMGRQALDLFAQNGIAIHAGAAGETPHNVAKAFLDGTLGGETPTCGHDYDHGRHGHGHACHDKTGAAH